jgi:hypothetical protein
MSAANVRRRGMGSTERGGGYGVVSPSLTRLGFLKSERGLTAGRFERHWISEGLPVPPELGLAASGARMAKRSRHAVSEGQDVRSERPATGHGQHRAGTASASPSLTRLGFLRAERGGGYGVVSPSLTRLGCLRPGPAKLRSPRHPVRRYGCGRTRPLAIRRSCRRRSHRARPNGHPSRSPRSSARQSRR